jgi:PAS domain S-box-containing protein
MSNVPVSDSLLMDATRAARLRSWIIAIGVLALAAFAGSSAYDSWRDYNHVISTNNRELANVGKALAEQLEGSLQSIDILLQATADWYSGLPSNATPESINGTLATRAAALPQVALLTITDAQGIRRYRSRDSAATEFSVIDRSYFAALHDDPQLKLFISEPIVTRSDGRTAFVLSRRLQDSRGRFAGVVAAVVELDEYQRFYHALNLGTKSAISLFRDDGTLVLRQPPLSEAIGKRYPMFFQRGDSSVSSATLTNASPIDGVPRFLVVTRVSHYPLVIGVGRDTASVIDPWRDETYRVAGRTLFIMLLGALAITAVVRQLRRIERGERALRESEERYALAMEGANEGHFDWNFDGGPSFLSPQMKLLHGRSTDAVVTTRAAWMAGVDIHRDDLGRLEAAVREHFEGRSDRFEAEYRVRRPDGAWHWLQVRGRCFRDGAGQVHRFVGSAMDITARKNAESEKERLEIQLRQSQKLEAMGTLAGGIAHDFNNILGAILGYGELAQKAAPEGGAVRRYLDNVMQAGGRAKSLVERILAFSRSGVGERGPINVQAVIEETLELMSASLPRGVTLVRRLEAGDAAIVGDATQLHQVAMNLGTNALQAMENGGVLEVVLDRADVAQSRQLSHGNLGPGAYVRLCVSDTGSGIAHHVLDRMFDPFFTTKGVGEGTGLGLSLVHGIVTDLGGAIDVHTAIGQGTAFTIWLPVSGEAVPSPEVATELPHGGGETVMIVDDEKALVALSEEMFAELGYEPIGFSSSVAALEAFREAPQRFDIILTDETMPELIGTALAREIHQLRPDVPIVLMSGYSGGQMLERARAVGIFEVLRKPLQRKDIAECFGRVLRLLEPRKLVQP